MLYRNETIYDDRSFRALLGDGKMVIVGGERRLLSRIPPKPDHDRSGYSTAFEDKFATIPRSEWSERLKEQLARKARVSDFQNFPPHDQDGLPTCWSNGPAHAATTQRVIQGLPYLELSACSTAVPISGGHVGGNEDTAVEYAAKYGWASCKVWPNNSTSRSLMDSSEVKADRLNHKALEWVYLGNKFENYATAALLGWPMAVAYNDWSHVVSLCDLVEIEPGHFGLRIRNNWGKWGAANEYGFYGYAVFPEGARSHGCPDSGFALRQVTSAAA